MNDFFDKLKIMFKNGGMHIKLLYVNVGVFIAVAIFAAVLGLFIPGYAYYNLNQWLGLSTDFSEMVFKPWTIITYMFTHAGFMHLLTNMIMLFFIGMLLQQFLGNKKILSIYILGGLVGAVLQIAAKHIFPVFIDQPNFYIVGASGAVMALAAAAATHSPNYEIRLFGIVPVKLWLLVAIFLLIDALQMSKQTGVAHFTHLGGGLIGYLVVVQLRKGKDITAWIEKLIDRISTLSSGVSVKRKPKMKATYSKFREQQKTRDDYEYNASKKQQEEKLNAILDKIKYKGYDGLTSEEKAFLNSYR